jgi:hypothetical protein
MATVLPPAADDAVRGADDVALYQRTYMTLLRSSGETDLRVLEASHRGVRSSLHPLADSPELDLGAFLYASARLPAEVAQARVVVMGQEPVQFARAGVGDVETWKAVESPARRRRWLVGPDGVFAVLLASSSDLDDLIPTLLAYQIEWNKLRTKLRAGGFTDAGEPPTAAECARMLGGSEDDWARVAAMWGAGFGRWLVDVAGRQLRLRIRMLGGSAVGYARMTRRWFAPVREALEETGCGDGPLYLVSSNTHSLANLVTGEARRVEDDLVAWLEDDGPEDLRRELEMFRQGRTRGSWENFLYFLARDFLDAQPGRAQELRAAERAGGVLHLPSRTALRVAAQVIPLSRLAVDRLDPRLGTVDAGALAASRAVILNIDYPLGLAAYNILREITEDRDTLAGVYVLGKAATLNADVGDVMISSVVHDEHTSSTYWLDNAFAVEDIAPFLRFGSGLDNQRAVTVKSTFLQNRGYLERWYREAYTVVEMEAGPCCSAIFEVADTGRHPVGEQVNFSKLPVDFGVIHYASDTPYTQARTLGARGLSYRGMDSTYASSIAILRRILRREGVLADAGARDGTQAPAALP